MNVLRLSRFCIICGFSTDGNNGVFTIGSIESIEIELILDNRSYEIILNFLHHVIMDFSRGRLEIQGWSRHKYCVKLEMYTDH